MDITQLNERFGLESQLAFIKGQNDFPLIHVNNPHASALISLYGAQVLAFQPREAEQDLLFLSSQADYQEGKAIRGGIPVCWPWFGNDPTQAKGTNHGFARSSWWELAGTQTLPNGATQIHLTLNDKEKNLSLWPQAFNLQLQITIANTLSLELTTHNMSQQTFTITQALHTYFRVGDIDAITVRGLENTQYLDKLDHQRRKTQAIPVTIAQETDRIYTDVSKTLIIDDPSFKRQIHITANTTKTAVVWNPWKKATAAINDLAPDDYRNFICVEAGNVADASIAILPGQSFNLRTHFNLLHYN